jgi:hypothetical protein
VEPRRPRPERRGRDVGTGGARAVRRAVCRAGRRERGRRGVPPPGHDEGAAGPLGGASCGGWGRSPPTRGSRPRGSSGSRSRVGWKRAAAGPVAVPGRIGQAPVLRDLRAQRRARGTSWRTTDPAPSSIAPRCAPRRSRSAAGRPADADRPCSAFHRPWSGKRLVAAASVMWACRRGCPCRGTVIG